MHTLPEINVSYVANLQLCVVKQYIYDTASAT